MSSGLFVHTKPPRTTVMKGEAGLKGSSECVRGGSTAQNLHEPPRTNDRGGRPTWKVPPISQWFEKVRYS